MFLSCPRCKYMFRSVFSFGGITNATLKGNKEQCPRCGALADTPDGTFSFDKYGLATLLSGPEFTPEVLKQLKQVTELARKKGYTPAQYKNAAVKISPAVATLFSSTEFKEKFWDVANSPATANFLALLAIILAVIMHKLSNSKNGNSIVHHHHYYSDNKPAKRIPGVNTSYTPPKKKRKK